MAEDKTRNLALFLRRIVFGAHQIAFLLLIILTLSANKYYHTNFS